MYNLLTEQPAPNPFDKVVEKAISLYMEKTGQKPTKVDVSIVERTITIHGEVYRIGDLV